MVWEKAESVDKDRLIVGVWGPPKTGKTHFATSAPGPIYYHNFDWGLEHHLKRLKKEGKELFVANYLTERPDMGAAEAQEMLRAFERDYAAALKAGTGTIVIDTSTQLWQLTSKVFLEQIKTKRRDGQVYPFDYADANAYFQNLINQVKKTKMNMILIQRAQPKYDKSGQDTGDVKQQGNNQVPYLVQVQLRLSKGPNAAHKGTVEECWDHPSLEGVELKEPSFDTLKTLMDKMDAV